MKIYIDIGNKEKKGDYSSYFISISLSEKEVISFDNTYKGYRVIRQVLVEKKEMPSTQEITSEWDTILIEDGKFVQSEHIRWVDLDKKDWCNNEVWKTVSETPIPEDLNKSLLKYATIAKKHYKELHKFSKEMSEFKEFLSKEIDYYKDKL